MRTSSDPVEPERWPGADGLAGRWSLARRTTGEPEGRVRGTAVLLPDADGTLSYAEAGRLVTPAGQFDVTRRFRYRATPDGFRIDFADGPGRGGPFVDLHFTPFADGAWVAAAVHPCGADRYDVRYRLALPDAWTTEIVVTGPKKRYRAITHYRRLGAATRLFNLRGLA